MTGAPDPSTASPSYALYSINQITLATILGAPIAGGLLIRRNLVLLGEGARGNRVLVWSALSTVLVFVVAAFLPKSIPGAPLAIGYTLGLRGYAQSILGTPLFEHTRRQGRLCSSWAATAIGVASLIAISVVMIGIYLSLPSSITDRLSDCVTFTPGEIVYYSEGSTAEHARAVGEALKDLQYFTANPNARAWVKVSGDEAHRVVAFMVKDGVWDDRGLMDWFGDLGGRLEDRAHIGPIEIRLCDLDWKTKAVARPRP
jgi:hypothetical protein